MNVNTDKLKKEAGHACNFSNSIIVSVAITFQVKMFASPFCILKVLLFQPTKCVARLTRLAEPTVPKVRWPADPW
jgi:hypothetical protein